MSLFLIINGLAGAGKTTAAKEFAQKNNYAFISQDEFLFELNAFTENRELKAEEHRVAIKNMHDCILNYMHLKRNIVMEGALVSISEKDPLNIKEFIKLGERMGYKVIVVTLTGDKKTRLKRQKERNYIVDRLIDQKIQIAIKKIDEEIEGEILIDSSKKSIKATVQELEKLVS